MKQINARLCYLRVFTRVRTEFLLILISLITLTACESKPPPPSPPTPEQKLIAKGRDLFFNETFNGNGRTCSTCHRAEANFTIDPAFIATLPDSDPLFVAEFNPDLGENFEKPKLMHQRGLILENLDGFEDLENVFVLRGVPPTLALSTSVESSQGPRLGWSGDGSARDGTLKSFAIGATVQHFTKTLSRDPGVDFRLPTEDELAALEAFQLAIGRQKDLQLPLPLRGAMAKQGQEIFLDDSLGKCNICHRNAGANAQLGGQDVGNANFNTGVENLPDRTTTDNDEQIPPDDGFGTPGDGTFNTPPLVEAADTAPFFHNNAIDTLEGAVAFYNSEAFNNSPAGQRLASVDPKGVGIQLNENQVTAVAAFLRVINVLENIRFSIELIEGAIGKQFAIFGDADEQLRIASFQIEDAVKVLEEKNLHPKAVADLNSASILIEQIKLNAALKHLTAEAIDELKNAHDELVKSE
jgi:cytochrome c peroxidase